MFNITVIMFLKFWINYQMPSKTSYRIMTFLLIMICSIV